MLYAQLVAVGLLYSYQLGIIKFSTTRFFTTQLVAVCHQLSYPTATSWARYLELLFQY
ncbi:MAG: hypothetical protein ACYTXT_32810 [Nostoc sp.]